MGALGGVEWGFGASHTGSSEDKPGEARRHKHLRQSVGGWGADGGGGGGGGGGLWMGEEEGVRGWVRGWGEDGGGGKRPSDMLFVRVMRDGRL